MNRSVQIYVTQDDIDHGARESVTNCPIALAAKRTLSQVLQNDRDVQYLSVSMGHINWSTMSLSIPSSAWEWYDRWDNELTVKPFSFTVEIPEELLARHPQMTLH